MAVTSDPWDASDLVAYISETWTPMVLEEWFAKAVAANFFTDLSPFAVEGSDIFHVPDVFSNPLTVTSQSTQGAEVTTADPVSVDVTLTVSTHKYIALLLGALQQVQVNKVYNISEIYNKKAGGTLMEDLEAAIFAEHSNITTNTTGDTASVIADVDIRVSLESLETLDLPKDELAFFFHPYCFYVQVLNIARFHDASISGWDGGGVIKSGNFGPGNMATALKGALYGVPVFTSSKVVNTLNSVRNLLAHPTAIAFAHQTPGGSQIRFQAENAIRNLGILSVWDTIYGIKTTREDAAAKLSASNAFIAS